MAAMDTNIILIGMPGSGKSTVGVLLAKRLGLGFVDTDLLIQQQAGATLQAIVDAEGYLALRQVEEEVLRQLDVQHHVISTGGSAVYSPHAMAHLRRTGVVVFLDIPLDEVMTRIGDHGKRGISRRPEQTFPELFDERLALYRQYADITVQASGRPQESVCEAIAEALAIR